MGTKFKVLKTKFVLYRHLSSIITMKSEKNNIFKLIFVSDWLKANNLFHRRHSYKPDIYIHYLQYLCYISKKIKISDYLSLLLQNGTASTPKTGCIHGRAVLWCSGLHSVWNYVISVITDWYLFCIFCQKETNNNIWIPNGWQNYGYLSNFHVTYC